MLKGRRASRLAKKRAYTKLSRVRTDPPCAGRKKAAAAAKGNAYSAEQNANLEALRKQQEAIRQQQEAAAKSASIPAITPNTIRPAATTEQLHRIGAICRDGSESSATGRGACSHHGGVRCWRYSECTCH